MEDWKPIESSLYSTVTKLQTTFFKYLYLYNNKLQNNQLYLNQPLSHT